MLPSIREHLNSRLDGGVVEIGPVLSRMVRAAIWKGDAEPALAIAPEECQEFLGIVRETLSARRDRNVVITDDDLRPFVRWMLEIEFPDIPVLARRELLEPLTDYVVADKRTEHVTQEIGGYEYAGARVPA
jgi:type III secretory pathway component EscV